VGPANPFLPHDSLRNIGRENAKKFPVCLQTPAGQHPGSACFFGVVLIPYQEEGMKTPLDSSN
jgi:hypothetical protein